MKIIGVDRETVADHQLIGSIPNTEINEDMAKAFCTWLNTFTCDDNRGTFYKVRPDNYILSRGMEDII